MGQASKQTVLDKLVTELESVLPALKELADVTDRLALAKQEEVTAQESAASAQRMCQGVLAECAEKVRAAEESRDKRIAEAEEEIRRRSAEAREKFEAWQITAKATRTRVEAEARERCEEVRLTEEMISTKKRELVEIESRLAVARQAFKSALAEVA